ncbi:MAG TPA: RDD family protein [Oculatellaceae cyanobacterium]
MTQEENRENATRPAGFVVRAVALLIDLLILTLAQAIPLLAFWTIDWETQSNFVFFLLYLDLVIAYVIASSIVPFWLYISWFERSKLRGTPGKYIMGLEVVDSNGALLSFKKSTTRLMIQYTIVLLLAVGIAMVTIYVRPDLMASFAMADVLNLIDLIAIVYAAGTIWCLFNKHKQTLFDLPVGRRVVFAQPMTAGSNTSENAQPSAATVVGTGARVGLALGVGSRIRTCAQLAWSELPKFRMQLPVVAFYGAFGAMILFNFGWILSQANQVSSIESKIERSGGKLSLLEALDELSIKPRVARHSYQNISDLFGMLLDEKTVRTYKERANQIQSDFKSVTRLAKLEAAENNPEKAAQLLTEYANSQTGSMVERGAMYGHASAYTTDKAEKAHLLKWAMTYAPYSTTVLNEKIKTDKESNDSEQTKIDQEQLDFVTKHRRSTIEDMTGLTDNNLLRDIKGLAEQILKRYPNTNVALFFTAQYLVNEGKEKEAEQLYTQAIANDATDPLPYERRSYFYSHEKEPQLDKALADIDKAIALDPQDAYWQQKISILKKKNDIAGVSAAITEASKMKPDFSELASNSVYLFDHGYKTEAIALVRLACDAYKTNINTRMYIDDSNAYGVSLHVRNAIENMIEVAGACGNQTDKDAVRDLINRAIPGRDRLVLLESLANSK